MLLILLLSFNYCIKSLPPASDTLTKGTTTRYRCPRVASETIVRNFWSRAKQKYLYRATSKYLY